MSDAARETTLQARVEDCVKHIKQTIIDNQSKSVNDEYGNKLLSIGSDDKVASFTNYGLDNDTLNWYLWTALYNDSWVFRRAIDKPSQDCIRCGITINGEFKRKEDVYTLLTQKHTDFIHLLQWGALYGGSVACIMFDNFSDEDYEKPFNFYKVRKSETMRMYVTDRWYGLKPSAELVNDMNSLDFGKPKFYTVTMADGHSVMFHHSYVLRYEHRTAPRIIKMGMLQGWGYAEGAHIINELYRDDKCKAAIQSLLNKSLIEVIKMPGMRGLFMGADQESNEQLKKRLEMVNWARTFNSLTFLDTTDDYIAQTGVTSGISGLAEIMDKNMWLVAAAVDMQGVLFGDLKNGMGADSDALQRYAETIHGRCEDFVRPLYEKFLRYIYKTYDINAPVDFSFNSLSQKKDVKDEMEGFNTLVSLLDNVLNAGVITPQQYAKTLVTYSKTGRVDFNLDDKAIAALSDRVAEEMEDIDLDSFHAFEKPDKKEKPAEKEKTPGKTEKTEKTEKTDKADKPEKPEKPDKTEKPEKPKDKTEGEKKKKK